MGTCNSRPKIGGGHLHGDGHLHGTIRYNYSMDVCPISPTFPAAVGCWPCADSAPPVPLSLAAWRAGGPCTLPRTSRSERSSLALSPVPPPSLLAPRLLCGHLRGAGTPFGSGAALLVALGEQTSESSARPLHRVACSPDPLAACAGPHRAERGGKKVLKQIVNNRTNL